MISRLVKMTFESGKVNEFLEIFNANAENIKKSGGCIHLELLHSRDFPNILFTYSLWESSEKLDEYRHSDLFLTTWGATKKLFSAPPEAWTLDKKWPDADKIFVKIKD